MANGSFVCSTTMRHILNRFCSFEDEELDFDCRLLYEAVMIRVEHVGQRWYFKSIMTGGRGSWPPMFLKSLDF